MTIQKTFITVTAAALAGLVMGGLFGLGAGLITPDFFRHITTWQDVKPLGFAVFCGATAGVLLGGGLGCFGIIIQHIPEWRKIMMSGQSPGPAAAAIVPTMKFSWKALILAPLPIPIFIGLMFMFLASAKNPLFTFLFFFVIGGALSYGTTLFIFLPSLFLVSRFTPLTLRLTALIGTVLGFLVYFPLTWEEYASSGVDSGPPEGTFWQYLARNGFQWDFWLLIFSGLITAVLYWLMACPRSGKKDGN
jgi:hypothetical protein